ncbi:MAG TPA: hypothetical protein EYP30_05775 [Archaeoglobaceae archaeon]|nr:hypothetical protein [Archaeoglobaceae archaeon]
MAIGRILLVVMLIFTIGLLVLPQTINVFAGGHTFYNFEEGGNCIKCHADVFEELKVSAYHSTVDGVPGVDGGECLGCHRANVTVTRGEKHAATITSCSYCHLNASNVFGAPLAGGFGLSGSENDTGKYAMHSSFVYYSGKDVLLGNETEACIACHTNIRLDMGFNVSTGAKFVVNDTYTTTLSQWEVKSMNMSKFKTYLEVLS